MSKNYKKLNKKSKTWKDQKEELIYYYKCTHIFPTHNLGILNQKWRYLSQKNKIVRVGWKSTLVYKENTPCNEVQWTLSRNCWELHKEEKRIETKWRTSRFTASLKAAKGMTPLLSLSNLFHLSSHIPSLGLLK